MAKKRKNAFVRYFTPFGIRQVCDIIMVAAMIMLILGLSLFSITTVLMPIGLGMFMGGALIAIYRSVRVLTSGLNKRSPEFKHAIANTIVMAVLLATAIVGMLYFFLWM